MRVQSIEMAKSDRCYLRFYPIFLSAVSWFAVLQVAPIKIHGHMWILLTIDNMDKLAKSEYNLLQRPFRKI